MAFLWVVCGENATANVAGGMPFLVFKSLPGLISCDRAKEVQLSELKAWPAMKSQRQLILRELVRSCVHLKLTACSTRELARGGQTALEHFWLLSLSLLLLQCWWRESKNFYCCGSDSPESNSKNTIFSLDICFSLPSSLYLLPQSLLSKAAQEGCILSRSHSSPVCHQR